MFAATLIMALGIASQDTPSWPGLVRDPRSEVKRVATQHGVSIPNKKGAGWRYMVAPACIDLCDNPYAYMAVRYRTFRPDMGLLEFPKAKPRKEKP